MESEESKLISEFSKALTNILTYTYSLNETERSEFVDKVDATVLELEEYSKTLVPELGEANEKANS